MKRGSKLRAWKRYTRDLQGEICLICGNPVEPSHGSYDHFVPQAKGISTRSPRLGLYFWTHGVCNSRRGHDMPTPAMVERALAIIGMMEAPYREIAGENIAKALEEHRGYVAILLALKEAKGKGDDED